MGGVGNISSKLIAKKKMHANSSKTKVMIAAGYIKTDDRD